jgi:type IV pilus assembly protein PilY1
MLHAFRVGYLKGTGIIGIIKALFKDFFGSDDERHDQLGEEIWAYIPFNAFPYLKYLADPNYCHIYYSDLSVRLVDVSTNGTPSSPRTAGSWQTILIGGMRFGGACSGSDASPAGPPIADGGFSSYFAIDISDPEKPIPLWEFSDADMGYATSFPSIIRTGGRDQNGHWYVALGSGSKALPKGSQDIGRTASGYVYILDLKTGTRVQKVQVESGTNNYHIVGDILAVDADKDYHSEKIYFGTSYYSSGWRGKLMSLRIPSQDLSVWTPASSDLKVLFSGNYPFTASPDAAKDTKGNVWVFSGSGKYYSDLDEADTSAQIFLGMIDAGNQVGEGSLSSTTTRTTGAVQGTTKVCSYNSNSKSFELQDAVTSIASASPPSAATVGWKIPLYSGERVISRPLAVGGLVDFLTYKPDADTCTYGGDSFLYSVGYTSGLAPAKVAILAPEATSGTSGSNVEVYKSIRLGPGAPPTGEAIIVPPPREGADTIKKKIQVATGVIVEAENQPAFSVVSKIIHRLKK